MADAMRQALAVPPTGPAFLPGASRCLNRECRVAACRAGLGGLRAVAPEPLQPALPAVEFEFIRMPASTGFGDCAQAGRAMHDGLA